MEKKIVGRESLSTTHCELEEDGTWKVLSEIGDAVLYDGESEWVSEKVDALVYNKDCQKAIEIAMNSTLGFLLDNVYKGGFKGLVEFREYERRLKEGKETADPQTEKPNDGETESI